jgi:hypothetical protein
LAFCKRTDPVKEAGVRHRVAMRIMIDMKRESEKLF